MNFEELSKYRVPGKDSTFYVPDFVTVKEYINYRLFIDHDMGL